eukprot:gnl/TRDRNA2_/TRDRNA2_171058_c0_seq1.p1 gnl/TRDRNA2_/TRDRNA2_171058_c0~~gnl/TRDRNA2_/TRDRNA2_171058_c0_seq1.p1  ORF type:complete len:577 (+),score=78.92 gnl/TRDRNA2_/TRDRNA2_171058_c0_seq1:88-1818(+)
MASLGRMERGFWRSALDANVCLLNTLGRKCLRLCQCLACLVSACVSTMIPSSFGVLPSGFTPYVVLVFGLSFLMSFILFAVFSDVRTHKHDSRRVFFFALAAAFATIGALFILSASSSHWMVLAKSRGYTMCSFTFLGPHQVVPFLIGMLCTHCVPQSIYMDSKLSTSLFEHHLAGALQKKGFTRIDKPWLAEVIFQKRSSEFDRKDLSHPARKHSCEIAPRTQGFARRIQHFSFTLEVAAKDELFLRLFSQFRSSEQSSPGSTDVEQLRNMFGTWRFLPETYLLSVPWQYQHFLTLLPCNGTNTDWILKGTQHGGKSVKMAKTYEELRKHLGEECSLKRDPHHTRGKHGKRYTHGHDAWSPGKGGQSKLAQRVVHGMGWNGGQRFLCRAYILVMKVPSQMSTANEEHSIGKLELYLFDQPVFNLQDHLVSDELTSSISLQNVSDLEAWTGSAGRWTTQQFIPKVSEMLRVMFSAAAQITTAKDEFEEPDGAFEFMAVDVILEDGGGMKIIDISGGPGVKPLTDPAQASVVPHVLQALEQDTIELFAQRLGPSAAAAGISVGHWHHVLTQPAVPHI